MDSTSSSRRRSASAALLLVILGVATIAVTLAACGDAAERPAGPERASVHRQRSPYLSRVRDAVIRGVRRDFALGTGIGGAAFEACMSTRLRGVLDAQTIDSLVAVYRRPYGTARAARALNTLAAPLAARCGHRSWMPELVEAAHGLRSAGPNGAAVRKLGVTYGPYLGVRCRKVGYDRCGRVGIDVVLGHAATRVVAVAGPRAIPLRTPGRHSRVRYRDWVGTFTHAYLPHRSRRDLAYVPVELRVRFASGRRARAVFPHTLLAPGWG